MASYKALVKDVIRKADVLLEIIDARFPDETRNSEVERGIVRLNKPLIIVINKSDLVSREKLEKTKARLSKIAPVVFVSSRERSGTTMLRHQILASAAIKTGIKGRDILVGTIGYPNVGKSSVINSVTGRHSSRRLQLEHATLNDSYFTGPEPLLQWSPLWLGQCSVVSSA